MQDPLNTSDFAGWLREQMQARGWSQADLMRSSGLTPAAISRVLGGSRRPGIAMCRQLAEAFQLPVDTVFRKAGHLPDAPGWTEEHSHLLYLFDQLSPEDQEEVLAIARLKLMLRERGAHAAQTGHHPAADLDPSAAAA